MAPERTRRGSRLAATPWNQVGLGGALSPSSAMREAPRVRLARDQCLPTWALLTGSLGKAMI